MTLIILPFAMLGVLLNPRNDEQGVSMLVVTAPYPLMGFIGGILLAALYNLAARIGGGFIFEIPQQWDNGAARQPDIVVQNRPPTDPVPL